MTVFPYRQPSPRGEGAPKGRKLDGDSGVKKSEEMRLKSTIYESILSTADAVPLPQGGRLGYGERQTMPYGLGA